ncbi:protein kinase domain-containing protein [Facklamia sp. P9177]|uniref:class III lanthionine synthetase LanKC N-terminal domain-containing protein n=1 Tax=Facklamia sp. P9177 TaxID=3421945 RepID=UPI003D17DB2F
MEKDSLFDLLSGKVTEMKPEMIYEEGIWSHYLPSIGYELPNYGFKIHISATLENVIDIAEIIFPILIDKNIKFKFIKSITHLGFLNMGNYGYSQMGKMCTIYPKDIKDLLSLLDICYKKTKKFASIAIPSDFPYMCSSVVYYRYGELKTEKDDNDIEFVDLRKKFIPDNIEIPIDDYYIPRLETVAKKYMPLKCLRVRGKSSVYLAIDIDKNSMCIIKRGNFLGEINLDGEDGLDKVYNEYVILKELKKLKLFPDLYDVFYKDKSLFIVEEFIEGEILTNIFLNKEIQNINKIILMDILKALKQVHLEGYLLNDLSPDNIMINQNRFARFIDGEYSVHEEKYTNVMNLVGTPGFSKSKYSLKDKDLYSFICICYFFFNRKHYSDLREETKEDFIKKVDENPRFLENVHVDLSSLLGMYEEEFFEKSYETKIEILEQIIMKC